MRKTILLFVALSQTVMMYAQTTVIEGLKQSLQNERKDTAKVTLLNNLSLAYLFSNPDSALLFAQEGLILARQIKFEKGEIESLRKSGISFNVLGNYPKALEIELQALRKSEIIHDSTAIAAILGNIGDVYSSEGDQRQSLNYSFQSKAMAESQHNEFRLSLQLLFIGDRYEKLNQLDSARFFTNLGYNLSMKLQNDGLIGEALNYFGNIYSKMGQNGIAMEYYRSSFPYLLKAGNYNSFCESALGIARLFGTFGNSDSCVYYAKLSLLTAQKRNFLARTMDAAKFLTDYYKSINRTDSAFVYQSATLAAQDSLFSRRKLSEILNLGFDEAIRQQEMTAAKAKALKERNDNIQYGIIGIGLVCFAMIFLLITRSIIVNEGWVRFLGILGLLLAFEFINLYIHPFIAEITGNTPGLMLVILVIIAALLIPLHHKIEHWIINKMVEKNKAFRLTAAKKTIAKLERNKPGN